MSNVWQSTTCYTSMSSVPTLPDTNSCAQQTGEPTLRCVCAVTYMPMSMPTYSFGNICPALFFWRKVEDFLQHWCHPTSWNTGLCARHGYNYSQHPYLTIHSIFHHQHLHHYHQNHQQQDIINIIMNIFVIITMMFSNNILNTTIISIAIVISASISHIPQHIPSSASSPLSS